MRRSEGLPGAAGLLAAAALLAACTGGEAPSRREDVAWALDGLAATSAAPAVQRSIDALPARGTAKILGIAEVSGIDVVLAIRNGTCQVSLLPDGLAEPTTAAPDSLGSQRPTVGGGFSDAHRDFPGSVLAGAYTQASAEMTPFTFMTVGCSEKAMAVRIEGVKDSAEARKKSGDSLRSWRDGPDTLLAVGAPEAIRRSAPDSGPGS
ncbi:hypothetical protein [Kitasatospora sp. NPDC087314]|uniref:hypothetical protein n=1 Tax=Kitasatospora sp. NPDC087314 TaxID=3364068 RepID=UPI0037F9CD37